MCAPQGRMQTIRVQKLNVTKKYVYNFVANCNSRAVAKIVFSNHQNYVNPWEKQACANTVMLVLVFGQVNSKWIPVKLVST